LNNIETNVVLQPVGDIVVVPLHGPVTQTLLTTLSTKILDHLHGVGARGIVLDMAGVELLDEQDFEELRKVVQSASIMGTPVLLAGIRPGLAGGLTMLDVDDHWINATRTVKSAMEAFA
jgi:rsbT antagonist protein RsbS